MRSTFAIVLCLLAGPVMAQEPAYFVTYDHYLEEPGNLEVAVSTTGGIPRNGNAAYAAPWIEVEYGVTGWWTTELYLEGLTTTHEGSGFTGWRWESRFRPLTGEHRINPVVSIEYEHVTDASRIQMEVVGTGPLAFGPVSKLRAERAHELEGKLILSSAVRGWNVSENLIVDKNLSGDEDLEFGYSIGFSRSLGGLASGTTCRFCRENLAAGMELYGGLGSTEAWTVRNARHYVAPVLAWRMTDRSTLKMSAGFGLTDASDRLLLRMSYAYELPLGD